MKILIVDDDDIAQEMLRFTLEEAGHEVVTATNGEEALVALRKGAARLVISDWDMPVMNGLDLCRVVREEDFDGYVYLMLLTSHTERHEIVTGLDAGADDFIAKPFDKAELLVRIRAGQRILSLETRDVAIHAMAKLAESRDPDTGEHLERVQWYARALAQRMAKMPQYHKQIDSELVRLIFLTSPLHDIGKVGIPDGVLRKTGRLTPQEQRIMHSHVEIGTRTLDAALEKHPDARFLQVARDIAASHHEHWNGSGYPRGLRGAAIPLVGRIVALADVYDALTTRRCYKEPFSHQRARDMIVGQSGKQFDPGVVEAFLASEDEFQAIFARFIEPDLNDEELSLAELVDA